VVTSEPVVLHHGREGGVMVTMRCGRLLQRLVGRPAASGPSLSARARTEENQDVNSRNESQFGSLIAMHCTSWVETSSRKAECKPAMSRPGGT
jgi:hypothetical protein